MIKLGQKVKCVVTGFEGTATARTEFLNGCVRITIQPPIDKDGKLPDDKWLDEHQLEIVDPIHLVEMPRQSTGGPGDNKPPQVRRPAN